MPINRRPHVLCVDNDEGSREMLSMLLGFSRLEAETVATAAQALSLIQAERFDLYVLEVWLPGLDGFELCRRMRDVDPHTPILFFSGAAYESDKKRGIDAGATDYVSKPDIDGLLGRIRQLVPLADYAAA
jgi:DNA-binding response OmpR family regulator